MPYVRIAARLVSIGAIGLALAIQSARLAPRRDVAAALVAVTLAVTACAMARWAFGRPYRDFEVRLRPPGGQPRRPTPSETLRALVIWAGWMAVRSYSSIMATYAVTVACVLVGALTPVANPLGRPSLPAWAQPVVPVVLLCVAIGIATYQSVESLFGALVPDARLFDPGTHVGGASLGIFHPASNVFEDSATGRTFKRRNFVDPDGDRLYEEWVRAEEARRREADEARREEARAADEFATMTAGLAAAYDLFDLEPGAGAIAVKRTYRRLAKLNHPDRNPDDPGAQSRMSAINEALTLLEIAEATD